MKLSALSKLFGGYAKTVLSWPNAHFGSKIGQKRLALIPDYLRPYISDFRRLAEAQRYERKHRGILRTRAPLDVRLLEFKQRRIARQIAAKREALEAQGISLELFGNRILQNIAKRHGIETDDTGTWRYGYYKITSRTIANWDLDRWEAVYMSTEVQERLGKLAKAKQKAEAKQEAEDNEWESYCNSLGIYDPKGQTARALRRGEIDEYEARLIAFKCEYRHEYTDYDSRYSEDGYRNLRRSGYSMAEAQREMREEARALMQAEVVPQTWLLNVGDEHTIRFLSVEPQVEAIDISEWLPRLSWVIQGGESGRQARPFEIEWGERLIGDCGANGVPYFLKQLGSAVTHGDQRLHLEDGHGGEWDEWPEHLQIREMPILAVAAI